MALKSKVRTATYRFDDNSLRLQASFENLEKLRAQTGQDPITYLTSGLDVQNTGEVIKAIRTIFFCLQADDATYTEEEIHNAMFGDMAGFAKPENMNAVASALAAVLGADIQAKLAEAQSEADDTPKNSPGSTA